MKHQLDFEKPIAELQSKLEELRKHPEAHSLGISFKEEIAQIEKKIAEGLPDDKPATTAADGKSGG